jgi:putative SOS response-associated peptidase YedK
MTDGWRTDVQLKKLLGLLQPYNEANMKAYNVSGAVNSVKNDREECVTPLVDAERGR